MGSLFSVGHTRDELNDLLGLVEIGQKRQLAGEFRIDGRHFLSQFLAYLSWAGRQRAITPAIASMPDRFYSYSG